MLLLNPALGGAMPGLTLLCSLGPQGGSSPVSEDSLSHVRSSGPELPQVQWFPDTHFRAVVLR